MNTWSNIKKAVQISNSFWQVTQNSGLSNLAITNLGNGHHQQVNSDHRFVNMSSYSYLGLDSHPEILRQAIAALQSNGSLNTSTSRIRIQFELLGQAEQALADLIGADVITVASCAAAAQGILPLVASGALTENQPPVLVFDKNAHFCLNIMKPVCADETEVITIAHNDLEQLEAICKKYPRVAYVADGVYSTGGKAPVKELLQLQEKYGLFLLFDEAHGLSTVGKLGRGLVLDTLGEINDRTVIITSLNKGFGASGGAVFIGRRPYNEQRTLISRFAGPFLWSQRINTAGLGGILASVALHHTQELTQLQNQLQQNIEYFDSLIANDNHNDGLPIRFIQIGSEEATISIAKTLFERGFYTSPIFFPVIARGKAGLRIMLRSNISRSEIVEFAGHVNQLRANYE
ncbi:aminotransferase class I/II-fold pyridoxal phosphate-dependent enzyme [Pantoea agglomerans]|uniref:aminotransferase class I/II-fold pyridoxal phosphate-dependent enzyme n=1 Tax=Enterobacter agglomerans TaxID=549 RepID=UPI00045CAA14|nr:aminotransferase class I/II-fold pyridoxal phosphate-dependent enzyme [Pantoea agglomerans]KDA94273.1 aminotransferase class I and II [Pantoea agglomerans Eh318]